MMERGLYEICCSFLDSLELLVLGKPYLPPLMDWEVFISAVASAPRISPGVWKSVLLGTRLPSTLDSPFSSGSQAEFLQPQTAISLKD